MIRDRLRTRGLVAAIGLLTVVGMLGGSVVAAQAIAAQEQQGQERARESTYSDAVTKVVAVALEAMAAGQERLQREKERLAKRQEVTVRKLHERLSRLPAIAPRIHQGHLRWLGMNRIGLHRGGMSAHGILAQAEHLGLSDEQVDQIRGVSKAHRQAGIRRNADIELAELDLKEMLIDADTADLDAVEAKMQEIAGLKVADRIAGLRVRQQMRAALSPEQLEQLGDERGHNFFMLRQLEQLEQLEDERGHNFFMLRRGGEGPHVFSFGDGEGAFDFSFGDGERAFEFSLDFDDFDSMNWLGKLPFGIFEFKSEPKSSESAGDEGDEGEEHQGVARKRSENSVGVLTL